VQISRRHAGLGILLLGLGAAGCSAPAPQAAAPPAPQPAPPPPPPPPVSEDETVGDDANGTTVHLHPGQKLIVRLTENRAAGYNWRLASGPGAHLSKPERTFEPESAAPPVPAPPSHVPGAPNGTAVFVFTAERPGVASVQFVQYSPWHRHSTRRTFRLRVVVGHG